MSHQSASVSGQLSRVLGAVLAVALLLLLSMRSSFATVPPIQPKYLACTIEKNSYGIVTGCAPYQIFSGSAPSPSTYTSALVGYVDTTAVSGTEATYLACTLQKDSYGVVIDCAPYQILKGSAPNPSIYQSWLIGYTYTTAVAETEATYLACTLVTNSYGVTSCGAYQIFRGAAPNPSTYKSWLIGYVYPGTTIASFTANPKYYIGSVIYVPPGPGSYIQYGSGTDIGTTLSTTQTWSEGATAGASEGTPKGSTNLNVSVTVGNTFGGSTMTSTDVELTINSAEKYQAPNLNVLNHDYDQILLFFGVQLTEDVEYNGTITWAVSFASLDNTNDAASGYPVAVGCLRANSTIPASECADTLAFLSSRGITSSDYAAIMNADPFANPSGSQVPASSRFVRLDSYSYYGDPTTVTFTYGVNNATTVTNSVTTSYSYSEGFSGSLFGISVGNTMTFTNSSTTSNKTQSTDTSVLSLTMPTTAYTGPTTLNLYQDTVYKTFMFSFY